MAGWWIRIPYLQAQCAQVTQAVAGGELVSEFLCGALMAALLVAPLVIVLLAWIIPETDDDPNF